MVHPRKGGLGKGKGKGGTETGVKERTVRPERRRRGCI